MNVYSKCKNVMGLFSDEHFAFGLQLKKLLLMKAFFIFESEFFLLTL